MEVTLRLASPFTVSIRITFLGSVDTDEEYKLMAQYTALRDRPLFSVLYFLSFRMNWNRSFPDNALVTAFITLLTMLTAESLTDVFLRNQPSIVTYQSG